MPKNQPVYVYPEKCTDYTTTGLVGDLMPLKAVFREEKNGISEIEVRMPYDEYEKWKACKEGRVIKAKVPVRVPPVINDDEYSGSVDIFEV